MSAVAKKDYASEFEAKVATDAKRRLADHVITTLRHDGLYRHWRCAKPGTGIESFNIVTWPGCLCYHGDMGDFLFQRTDDMVAFMRKSAMSFSYAEEKCIAHGEATREFRMEVFHEWLAALPEGYDEDDQPTIKRRCELLRGRVSSDATEDEVHREVWESELADGGDFPNFTAFKFRFLWCLFAIQWFCDNVKEPQPPNSPA